MVMGVISATLGELAALSNKFLFIDAPSLDEGKLEKTLLLHAFSGFEGVSQLFSFDLNLYSRDANINFDKIIGQDLTIGFLEVGGLNRRAFNGVVSRFVQLPGEGRLAHYQAEMVPWLWLLTRTADCRIFQNSTVPDIVIQVLHEFGFRDVESRLQKTYIKHECCVQYHETALNFVMRLMEQEGIFFFFKHETDKHILVVADTLSKVEMVPGRSTVSYRPLQGTGETRQDEAVHSWSRKQEFRACKYALRDFNFETPDKSLQFHVESTAAQPNRCKFEIYDYPGKYGNSDQGDATVRRRMEEEDAARVVITGESDLRSLAPGFLFELSEFQRFEPGREQENGLFFLTSVMHEAREGEFRSTGGGSTSSYSNAFTCVPSSVPFCPRRVTSKPIIQGAQTAIVVGPKGEEIYTDKYGRIKVQFHWDRYGKRDETSSYWIRVAQPWAGKGWGAISIPRVGDEVVVDFIDGDPDRPIVTGCVYNSSRMPPYRLPGNHTHSGIRTRSSKSGGDENFSEICFEDKKGDERLVIHAEKFKGESVEGDSEESVGRDRRMSIARNQQELVQGDKHGHVKGHRLEKVEGDASLTVVGRRDEKVGSVFTLDSGQEIHLKGGSKIVLESDARISLKAGANFIDINPSGIAISGTLVRINSGGSPDSGTAANPTEPEDPKMENDGRKA